MDLPKTGNTTSPDLYLIAAATLFSAIVTWHFGSTFNRVSEIDLTFPGLQMLLICGTGWVIVEVAAMALLGEKALRYIANLAIIQAAGVTILLPVTILGPPAYVGILAGGFSVLLSSALMLGLHIWRANAIGISQGWTVAWLLSLWVTATGWTLFFLRDGIF